MTEHAMLIIVSLLVGLVGMGYLALFFAVCKAAEGKIKSKRKGGVK